MYFAGDDLLVANSLRRLKRRKGVHFQRKLRELADEYAVGRISLHDITVRVQAWVNHTRYANTVGLRKAVLREAVIS